MKKWMKCILIPVGLLLVCGVGLLVYIQLLPGNGKQYDFNNIAVLENSPLKDKNICVLGSSVTDGMAAKGNAIGEYIGKRFDCTYTKEAVIGTTLADYGYLSYIDRLIKMDTTKQYDLLICQLSTNDATKGYPLGEISQSDNLEDFDTKTITGALQYVILYTQNTWNCPVIFYTNCHFDNEGYAEMVKRLYELQEFYPIGIIDLWHSESFNSISGEQRKLFMFDKIHPTMAGYREWWGPEIEKQLLGYLEKE